MRPFTANRSAARRPMNPDFTDFITALIGAEARFIIVGAHALEALGEDPHVR